MKTAKRFTVMILIFALVHVAAAQSYVIRVDVNANLRSGPGLDNSWVESVPTGTELQVVGQHNRWLRIDRNGRELWMADWLRYSRVAGGAAPASQPVSNIDNCCFVDRQCATDAEWTAGYYAFQNGQCAAPVQTQTQTSTQPVASAPVTVDNCCFVDRLCHTEADWTAGFYAYQNGQCPVSSGARPGLVTTVAASINLWTPHMTEGVKQFLANPSSDPFNNCCYMLHDTCHSAEDWRIGARMYQDHNCVHPAPLWTLPTIVASETPVGGVRFTDLVNTVLDLMRLHAPEWYKYLQVSGVRQFKLVPGMKSAGFYNMSWSVGLGYWSARQENPYWRPNSTYILKYVEAITHEACHAIKQRTYMQTSGWENEFSCLDAGIAARDAIRPHVRGFRWPRT